MNPACRIFLGEIPTQWGPAIGTVVLYAAGAFSGFFFLTSPLSWVAPFVATLPVTGLFVLSSTRSCGRVARFACRLALAAIHAFFLYEAASLATLLHWTWPVWVVVALAVLLVGWVFTSRSGWRGPRIPLVLPLGLASLTCLWGWVREESLVRCDDYLEAVSNPTVNVLVPTRTDFALCSPKEVRFIHRYPRKVVEDGDRVVFTTQAGAWSDVETDSMPGAVCEVRLPGGMPHCAFEGKAHAVRKTPELGWVLVAFMRLGWGEGRAGALMALPVDGGLEPVKFAEIEQSGEVFVDPTLNRVGLFGDRQEHLTLVNASSFEAVSVETGRWNAGEARYDPTRHEGVLCGSAPPKTLWRESGFLARAFRLEPRADRFLGEGSWRTLGLSWGCDVDFERRRVFASVANLGLIVEMDLDTGQVIRSKFVALGLRSVLLDASRNKLYVADFLRGRVHEIDVKSLEVFRTWFAGRYVRDVVLGQDGRYLLVTSNLGVVRIVTDPLANHRSYERPHVAPKARP